MTKKTVTSSMLLIDIKIVMHCTRSITLGEVADGPELSIEDRARMWKTGLR